MRNTITSRSNIMTLEDVILRLSSREVVDGVIVIGSASEDKLSPASDYDLVVVLSNMPVPLHVGVTYIDQRLTDIIFVTVAEIDHILMNNEPVDADSWVGRTIRWLQVGQIAFDRSGRLAQAQQKAQTGEWLEALSENEGYGWWFKINYNLAQTKRLLISDDPGDLTAADFRMVLYGASDLLFGYFKIRKLRWEGDKAAIRYLIAQDPNFLELFREFVLETHRERRVTLYEQLAALTTAPVGGIWGDGTTAIQFKSGTKSQPGMIEDALRFWESLITD